MSLVSGSVSYLLSLSTACLAHCGSHGLGDISASLCDRDVDSALR